MPGVIPSGITTAKPRFRSIKQGNEREERRALFHRRAATKLSHAPAYVPCQEQR
jgi:hypothetical protein